MPTLQELESSFRKAHAAGDTKAASALANAVRAARTAQPQGMSLYDRANDDAKSFQSGVVSGAHELGGMFGSARDFSNRVVDWGAQKLGASPETAGQIANASQYLNPLTAFAPSGQQLKQATGFQPHQSQTAEGPYLQSVGEFIPGMVAGPGGVGRNLLSAGAAGVASEGAGQLAHEYAPSSEPYVRAGAAIATTLATGKYKGPKELTTADKKLIRDQKYAVAKQDKTTISPDEYTGIVNKVGNAAEEAGVDPDLTGNAYKILEKIIQREGTPKTPEELDRIRQIIALTGGDAAANERMLSKVMRNAFDEGVDEVATTGPFKEARQAHREFKNSELVDDLDHKIALDASKFSMSGKENAIRANYRQLAKNKSQMRRFDQPTRDAVDKAAMGGTVEDAARMVGKMAPTGIVPFGAAVLTGDYTTAIAMMGSGTLARIAATKLTGRNKRLADVLIKHGGAEGLKSIKEDDKRRLAQALARALISSQASQGAGTR